MASQKQIRPKGQKKGEAEASLHALRRLRALWCAARGRLSRVLARGRFDAAPHTPHAFVHGRRGPCAFAVPKRTPPLCSPHGVVPPPPEGAAPGGFPLGLLLAGRGEKNERGYQLPFISLAACVPPPGARAASLAALLLALPPPRLRRYGVTSRSLNARGFRAFLRRFKNGGANSLPCGLRARGRPARTERVRAADVSGNFVTGSRTRLRQGYAVASRRLR